jgi:FkbM family methyltransferase
LANEAFPLAALRALIRPGDVVYDVGANIGLYTRVCITCFQAGHVVAFEPMTDNRRQLSRNIELGACGDKVTVLPCALADVDAVQEIQIDDMSSATASLASVTANQASQGRKQYGLPPVTEQVACRRLDSVLAERNVPAPNVIKVDIEGAEDLFFAGALECLARWAPRLVVELHGAEKARAVFDRLASHGYACAGRVGPHLDPTGYCRLDSEIIGRACGDYDVHYLVATKDAADLPTVIEPFPT